MSRKRTHEEYVKLLKEIHGDNIIVLEQYIGTKTPILHKCLKHNIEYMKTPAHSLMGLGCRECANENIRKLSGKSHEEYLQSLKDKNIKYYPIEQYINNHTIIMHHCPDCDNDFPSKPNNVLHNWGCPFCSGRKVKVGFNDLWTVNPTVASWLYNPDDGYNYTEHSKQKVDWKCPLCGDVIKNKTIDDIVRRGLSCQLCSDGISIPEKIMGNVLSQLDINYTTQKMFDWCNVLVNNNQRKCKYDFYFVYNNIEFLVETDGGLGHGNILHSRSNLTIEQTKYIDDEKDRLAGIHNINIIRIDCKSSDYEYIQNSILNSELKEIIDLSKVNWLKCFENASNSKMVESWKLWDIGFNIEQIIETIKMSRSTVLRYLKVGMIYSKCSYIPYSNKIK